MKTTTRLLGALLFAMLALFVFTLRPVNAASITVNTLADEDVSNSSCSLREAIQAASNDSARNGCIAGSGNDVIYFSVSGTIDLVSPLPFITIAANGKVTIEGGNQVTINGAAVTEALPVYGATVELRNLTFANGSKALRIWMSTAVLDHVTFSNITSGSGIAVEVAASDVTIMYSTFSGNKTAIATSDSPAGPILIYAPWDTFSGNTYRTVSAWSGTWTITNSTFTNNTGEFTILNLGSSAMTVTNSTFSNNITTGGGGAIYNGAQMVVTNSTFTNNVVTNPTIASGGAIGNIGSGSLTVTDSTFSGNQATSPASTEGGAIFNESGTLNISNSLFSGNSAAGAPLVKNQGGAIYAGSSATSDTTLNNVTIVNNSADNGSAVYLQRGNLTLKNSTLLTNPASNDVFISSSIWLAFPGTTTFTNNIFAISSTPGTIHNLNCGSEATVASGNVSTDGSCNGSTTVSMDALALGTLGSYGGTTQTIPLLPGSAAINAGDNASCLTTDARGISRPQQSTCDAGAFESRGFTLTRTGGNIQTALTNTAFANPLTLTVSSPSGDPVNGGSVTFTAPASGASTTFAPSTTVTIASGAASLTPTANSVDGSYTVNASTLGSDTTVSYTLRNNAPPFVVSILRADANPTDAASVNYTVTFSEAVTGVNASDFPLTTTGLSGSFVTGVSGSGAIYTVTVGTGSGIGTLHLDLFDNDSIRDALNAPLGGPGNDNGSFTGGETYQVRYPRIFLPLVTR